MEKQFLSKSVPKGTRTIWRYLSALFILFTFAIGNVWAASSVIPASPDYKDISTVATSGTYTFTCSSSNITGAASATSSWVGWYSTQSSFKEYDKSGSATCMGTQTKIPNLKYDKVYFYVTNCTSFEVQAWGNGDNRHVNYSYQATDADSPTANSFTSANNTTCASSGEISLNASKSYEIVVWNDAGEEIGITYMVFNTSSGDDTTAPTLSSSTPADDATNVAVSGNIVLTMSENVTVADASKFSLTGGAGSLTTASISESGAAITIPYEGLANSTEYTFTAAAGAIQDGAATPNTNAEFSFTFKTVAAETPACPSGLTISGTTAYTEGDKIELTAALTEGNGTITYQWYKGSVADGNEISGATAAKYEKASCTTADAGDYFCVASKAECSDAVNASAYAVTVEAISYCAELNPATSGDEPVLGTVIAMQTGSYGGSIKVVGRKQSGSFAYTANGLTFNKGGVDSVRVTLNHLIKKDTKIYVTVNNQDGSKDQGFYLQNLSKTKKADMHRQNGSTGDTTYVYTADNGDGLVGVNEFIIARGASSAALKSLKVSNCGAELFALNSAIYPAEADGKATITLSKSLVAEGATATATYSAIDAAYDFDEWEVSGATIDDAKANPVTITMGSTAATITLKLKAASTKHTVTYYDENDNNLGEELVVEGEHPVGLSITPYKLGYTFAGWGTSKAGPVVAFNEVTVNADMPLYTIWNAINCSAQSGTIFSLVADPAKAPESNTYYPSTKPGSADLSKYATVTGGIAQSVIVGTSNNAIQIQTTTSVMKITADNTYIQLDFDCPLKEGDKITWVTGNNAAFVSKTTTRPSSASDALLEMKTSETEFVIPAEHGLIDAQTIYVWKGGGNTNVTSVTVVRPAHFAVTFNMHDHGDAVDPQSVVEGGKVTKPTDPTASGWDFGGWFKESTYDNEWDFDNDVVNAATEIHAKWTEHTTSHDATLSSLSYTIGGGDPIAIPLVTEQYAYAVELPMGTDIDAPVIAAVANDPNVKEVEIVQTNLGVATVTVTAEDNSTIQSYAITFSVATSKAIQLVFKTGTTPCVGSASTATQILSNNAAVSTYINQITFTNVEGAGDDGAEGSSLNVGKKAGNMFTLSAKAGYAFQAMNFLAKIQDATCEYSINGGDWTELASTNTGADECYALFSAAEVHEFRLRSTGASGVWIRNMQLTIIEACTPVAITWDEEPVEFEVGASGQVIAATANTGNDVEYSSDAPLVIAVDAVNGLLSIGDLGSATLSVSTAEGDGTTFCENGGNDIVISKVVNTYFLVTLDAQNGETPSEIKFFSGDAAIAEPSDPVFAGHTFLEWQDANNEPIAWPLTPDASLTLHATWQSDCNAPQIVEHPESANYFTGRAADALECQATAQNNPDGELSYVWYSCDNASRENPVALSGAPTPSTAVAGTFYFYCDVTEEGCANVAHSDVAVITVADKDPICLAWVDVTGQNAVALDASKSLYAPEVSAANLKNTSSYGERTGWKFNNSDGSYIAIENAPFKSGDIVEVFVTTIKEDKMRVFNANEALAANVVAEGANIMVQGANKVTLTADANNLYLRRGDDFDGWNPYVAYVAVNRACAPILNKVTVAGVEAAPDAQNKVAIEVPASTADAALEAIAYDWVSNNADWTAAHAPAVANAWEWGVENTLTFADKDGDESVYYVTISKAAASSDATLSALTVNGQAIALADGVFDYTFELPYGASVVPTVAATPNHVAAVATVDPCTLSGATITVVPESGEADKQVYTLTFTISAWKEVIIWDGSNMSAVKAVEAADIASWAVNGFGSIANYAVSYAAKDYVKCLPSGGSASSTRNIELTVPAGYVAKFYIVGGSHSDNEERSAFIATTATKVDPNEGILTLVSPKRVDLVGGTSEIVGAGTYYINMTASYDFYEIRAYVRKGMVRNQMLGNGVLGTSCVDHNVAIEDIQGATFYELVGREPQYGKLAFDEIVSGELEAGAPYLFQAHGDRMVLFFGDTKVDDPVDKGNGMYGTFEQIVLTDLTDVYYFAQRALWSCDGAVDLTIPANRAYVKLSEIGYISDPNPAPGRRRVTMSVNGEKIATGIDELNASDKPVKMIINGQLFIIRGEKMYDAKGQLVK